MPAKNPRINITMEEPIVVILTQLAEQEHKSISHVTKELILEAREHREDIALSMIAQVRETIKTKSIKHGDAWK